MSCGKRPLIKKWDRPKHIRVITPSRYEQNEPSVKQHWKNVVKALELTYKDDKFWESQSEEVRQLVGPVIFNRLGKIFDLPLEASQYEPKPDITSSVPSERFYRARSVAEARSHPTLSESDFEPSIYEEDEESEENVEEEQSEQWSLSSVAQSEELKKSSRMKSIQMARSKSLTISKLFSKSKMMSKLLSKTLMKSYSSRLKSIRSGGSSTDESTTSGDDLEVHLSTKLKSQPYQRRTKNPHFEMLYCNESESDMINWNSHYKEKQFEVSAFDEFSKKAEIATKKIAKDFYDWWVGLGSVEFKSEIKQPEDIEDLFQVWFDEHASRGLVLHPKILPCVLKTIAEYVREPKLSCPKVLKRQIAFDIHAETSPAHVKAFNTSLPQKMKHIPPKNNTATMWRGVQIPEDLRSMACVWDEIEHLTSTKTFHKWLQLRPHLSMPPCLKKLEQPGDKKPLFVVPSDYVAREKSGLQSAQELALPVSQFSIELKEVLSKLMNQ